MLVQLVLRVCEPTGRLTDQVIWLGLGSVADWCHSISVCHMNLVNSHNGSAMMTAP